MTGNRAPYALLYTHMHTENGPVIGSIIKEGFKNGLLLLEPSYHLVCHNAKL